MQDIGRFQPQRNGLYAASRVKLPSLKPSKISTKPVDIFVENLSRAKSDRADLGIPSPRLKYRQRYKKLIHFGISAC
jgi:hypothetical protein